jgi:hypothetical protein
MKTIYQHGHNEEIKVLCFFSSEKNFFSEEKKQKTFTSPWRGEIRDLAGVLVSFGLWLGPGGLGRWRAVRRWRIVLDRRARSVSW